MVMIVEQIECGRLERRLHKLTRLFANMIFDDDDDDDCYDDDDDVDDYDDEDDDED